MTFQAITIVIIIILNYWTLAMKQCDTPFTESAQPHKVDVFIPIAIIIMRKLKVKG